MLRVNLLPGYVAQRRLTKQLTAIFAIVFAVAVVVPTLLALFILLPAKLSTLKAAADAEALKQQTDNAKTLAAGVRSDVAPIEAKLKFTSDVRDYNKSWAQLYDTVARYTDPKMIYTDATVSGTSLSIKAYAPSIAEVGRYLEAIYKEPDFQTVSIDKLPGYPEAVVNKYYLDGKLIGVGSSPFGGQQNGGGSGRGGSPSPSPSGGGRSFSGGSPGRVGGGPSGGGGSTSNIDVATLSGEQVVPIDQVLADRINPLGTPAQVGREYLRALGRIRVKQEPKGFGVTITAVLKKPLTPPALPGATGGTTSGPAGFGAPGAPGAYPGGPGGPGGYPGGPGGRRSAGPGGSA